MTDPTPSDRELEALKVLWQHGAATVRQVSEAITADKKDLAYTTVLSLMQVMEQKGLVSHKRVGKAYVYLPRIRRAPTLRRLAGDFLETVFDGAVDEYLAHALHSRKLTEQQLQRLDATIAAVRKRSRSEPKKQKPS